MGLKNFIILLSLVFETHAAIAQSGAGVGDIGSSDGSEEVLYVPLYNGPKERHIGYDGVCSDSPPKVWVRYPGGVNGGDIRVTIFPVRTRAECEAFIHKLKVGEMRHPQGKIAIRVSPEGELKGVAVVSQEEGNNDLKGEIGASSCTFVVHATPAGLDGFGCRSDLSARTLSCTDAQGLAFTTVGVCSQGQSAIDCFNGTHVSKNKDASPEKGAQ